MHGHPSVPFGLTKGYIFIAISIGIGYTDYSKLRNNI